MVSGAARERLARQRQRLWRRRPASQKATRAANHGPRVDHGAATKMRPRGSCGAGQAGPLCAEAAGKGAYHLAVRPAGVRFVVITFWSLFLLRRSRVDLVHWQGWRRPDAKEYRETAAEAKNGSLSLSPTHTEVDAGGGTDCLVCRAGERACARPQEKAQPAPLWVSFILFVEGGRSDAPSSHSTESRFAVNESIRSASCVFGRFPIAPVVK